MIVANEILYNITYISRWYRITAWIQFGQSLTRLCLFIPFFIHKCFHDMAIQFATVIMLEIREVVSPSGGQMFGRRLICQFAEGSIHFCE
jgi:hypothetical protein